MCTHVRHRCMCCVFCILVAHHFVLVVDLCTDLGGDVLVRMEWDIRTDTWVVHILSTVEPRLLDPRVLVLLAVAHSSASFLGLGVLSYLTAIGPLVTIAAFLSSSKLRSCLMCRKMGYKQLHNKHNKRKVQSRPSVI